MTQPIEDAISQIVTVVQAVTGITQVPVNPPETVNVATFALVYAEKGKVGISMMGETSIGTIGNRGSFHNIAIDVLTTRTDIAQNLAFMKPFIDTVPAAILAQAGPNGSMFSGKITTFGVIDYEWFNPKYAGVQYTGYHFVMNDVKILIQNA
jgi:hypothetical protein